VKVKKLTSEVEDRVVRERERIVRGYRGAGGQEE
jgi:hypothetical protein